MLYSINLANYLTDLLHISILYVYRLLTDHFYITEDCLNKLHEYPTKITFVKTICLSIFSGLIQALSELIDYIDGWVFGQRLVQCLHCTI